MKISLVSMDQAWEDKPANFKICQAYVKDAADQMVDLVVFPEMTLTGFSFDIAKNAEDEKTSQTIEKFSKLAQQYKIAILFGVVISDGEKALNRCYFLDANGHILGSYTKTHPFSFSGENEFFNRGQEFQYVNFKNHNIGLAICYDLRFPEVYTALAKNCDVIITIANWPQKRVDHWNCLLKARAIENQIFIVGVNRVGQDGNGLQYVQSSDIYDMNGAKLPYIGNEQMKIVDIDKQQKIEYQQGFDTVKDRNVELYKANI